MSLRIVENIEDANYITHNGSFHADEVFCTALFELLYGEVDLYRTRELAGAREDAIIFDVGKGELDHHQKGGNGQREDGTKYAAFGLVWKKYGKKLLTKMQVSNVDEVFSIFDESIVNKIDSIDNGQMQTEAFKFGLLDISSIIEHLNPGPETTQNEDEQFMKAFNIIKEVFVSEIEFANLKYQAKNLVENIIKYSESEVIFIPSRLPWEHWLLNSKDPKANDILYVIRQCKKAEDGYSINAVPVEEGSYTDRLFFPKEWGGRNPEELYQLTGIETLKFCHTSGFLCITSTLEDAYKTAKLSIEMQIGRKR